MTKYKSEACRKETELIMEVEMIDPSSLTGFLVQSWLRKKGRPRFCSGFLYLNAVTIKCAYPISRIDDILSKLGDANFFWTLGLGSVSIRKQDR